MPREKSNFREAVKKGLVDVKAGRVITLDEARRRLQQVSTPAGK